MGQLLCKDCTDRREANKQKAYEPAPFWAEGMTDGEREFYYSNVGTIASPSADDAMLAATPPKRDTVDLSAMKTVKLNFHAKHRSAGLSNDSDRNGSTRSMDSRAAELTGAKSAEVIEFIEDHLTNSLNDFIFGSMSGEERMEFIKTMELVRYSPNEFVIKQGEMGDFFYVVDQGTVSIYVENSDCGSADVAPSNGGQIASTSPDNKDRKHACVDAAADNSMYLQETRTVDEKNAAASDRDAPRKVVHQRRASHVDSFATAVPSQSQTPQDKSADSFSYETNVHVGDFTRGDTFGELALLYHCPRAATCISRTKCDLWRIDAYTFRRLMATSHHASLMPEIVNTLKKVSIFSDLDDDVCQDIANALIAVTYNRGERIVEKGVDGTMFHVVKEGSVNIHDIGHGDSRLCDVTLCHGDWFGEMSLLKGEKTSANATAASDVVVTLALSKEQFETRMGRFKDVLSKAITKKTLSAIPSFAGIQFKGQDLDTLVGLFQEVVFQEGQKLVTMGKVHVKPALYLVNAGKIQISDEEKNSVHILQEGDYFGAKLLQPGETMELWTKGKVVESMEESRCSMLTPESIESVLGVGTRLRDNFCPNYFARLDRKMKLNDLKKHRILGVGSFGRVWLAEHKKSRDVYALKVMDKRNIIDGHSVQFLYAEKNIMASIEHPFIVNLVAVFQDLTSVYLLQNFIPGGELFTVLHNHRTSNTARGLPNGSARFYAACLWESLSHLHKKNICYRDLKPENVLIDADGYCILIDLGLSKVVLDTTNTKCGTVEYFSPELILGRGYDTGADIWSFGVITYECLCGQTPFMHADATPLSLFRKIVRGEFAFPDSAKHGFGVCQQARDLIRGLLTPNQEQRLGCRGKDSDNDIRHHGWFAGIMKGCDLLQKKVSAPFRPKIQNALDSSNFESYRREENEEKFGRRRTKVTAAEQALFNDF